MPSNARKHHRRAEPPEREDPMRLLRTVDYPTLHQCGGMTRKPNEEARKHRKQMPQNDNSSLRHSCYARHECRVGNPSTPNATEPHETTSGNTTSCKNRPNGPIHEWLPTQIHWETYRCSAALALLPIRLARRKPGMPNKFEEINDTRNHVPKA